jgi:hypothetical protein
MGAFLNDIALAKFVKTTFLIVMVWSQSKALSHFNGFDAGLQALYCYK